MPRPFRWLVVGLVLASYAAACTSGTDDAQPATSPPPTTAPAPASTATVEPAPPRTPAPVSATATITGAEELLFDWSDNSCGADARPDLPTAAYRDGDDQINLILSSDINHRLVGTDFGSLRPDCEPVLVSAEDPDPSRYRYRQWIGALYTDDGETIHALVHNEFHGDSASFADSRRGFSATDDLEGWSYFVRGTSGPLEAIDGQRRVPDTLCSVAEWGVHPDVGCEPVRRWTAPSAGTYTVRMVIADAGIGGGDGVDVDVRRADEVLFTLSLDEGDNDVTPHEFDFRAAEGDRLDFSVAARADAQFDATTFEITINSGAHPCPSGVRDDCQMMALTYAQSTDGGASYSMPESNDHLVATVPQVYEPGAGLIGVWQPSNIVPHPDDGFFYVLAQLDVHEASRDVAGMCLLRTDDLSTPSSWRAWDGDGFGYEFTDPYADGAAAREPCVSVVASPGWSLTYSTYLEQFVMLTESARTFPTGVYFRTSPDLVSWSDDQLMLPWTIGFANDFATPFEAYPSLIDPTSDHRSFATIGQTADLYYTRVNSLNPLDFDLVRVPIRFDLDR